MKYLNLTKNIALIAVVSLVFIACKKAKVASPMGDNGQTLVKLLSGGTPASISSKPIDFLPTPTQIVAVEVRRDVPSETELNKVMVVTVKDDTAAVTAASAAYIQLPPAWFTTQGAVKTGGQGGIYTVTFQPGEFSKTIFVTVPDATLFNPSAKYALGFTILTADQGAKLSTQKGIVVEIGAKNAYDGIYSVESGWVQRYTAGVPDPGAGTPGNLNGDLTGNPDVIMATIGAYTVAIPPSSVVTGRLHWAFTSGGSGVAGVDGIQLTVNPATNLTSVISTGYGANSNVTFANWAGHINDYNPATRTFRQAWRWNPTGNTREYEIVLKWKGPR